MKKMLHSFVMAFFGSLAIFLNISLFEQLVDIDYQIFYDINVLFMGIIFIVLYKLFDKNRDKKITKLKWALAIMFALFMVIGECYVESATISIIWKSIGTILVTIFKLIGYSYIFKTMFVYLDNFINGFKNKELKVKNKFIKKYIEWFEKYPFRTSLISILIAWSIYLIGFYPIIISPDPAQQIRQYFNVPTVYTNWVIQRNPNVFMTSHHPVTQTFLLGWCIELGRFILDDNFGLFLYTILQTITFASILAYSIYFAKKAKVSNKLSLIVLLMYMFVPMYPFYTVSAVKDTYYTVFMMLFVLFIYDLIHNYKDKEISVGYAIYLMIVMLLIGLFRHNGIYIIIFTIPFILFYSRKNMLKIGCSFLVFMVLIMGFNKVLVPSLGISGGSVREMLSVPFQQTARYVKYHRNELSKDDIEVIDKMLGYNNLAIRYKPELADPVKNDFNKDTTTEDLKKYVGVWAKGLVKHPETYIDATLHNTYGYIYPNIHNWYVYGKYNTTITKNNLVDYYYNHQEWLRDGLSVYGNIFPYIPLIGLLSTIGANTWFLLILSVYLINSKNKKYLISLIPLYGTLLFCIIGPANTYFRYTMPYVFLLPIMTILLIDKLKRCEDE